MDISSLITYIANDDYFIVIVSIFTIVGTIVSIFVLLKSNSISKVLLKNNQSIDFDKQKNKLITDFTAYRDNFLEDNFTINKKLISEIRVKLLTYKKNFNSLLGLRDKFIIWKTLRLLKQTDESLNLNDLCLCLDNLLAKFNIKRRQFNG